MACRDKLKNIILWTDLTSTRTTSAHVPNGPASRLILIFQTLTSEGGGGGGAIDSVWLSSVPYTQTQSLDGKVFRLSIKHFKPTHFNCMFWDGLQRGFPWHLLPALGWEGQYRWPKIAFLHYSLSMVRGSQVKFNVGLAQDGSCLNESLICVCVFYGNIKLIEIIE